MNSVIYEFVAFVLQSAQAHNITIDGGAKYNVPSERVTIDKAAFEAFLNEIGAVPAKNMTSHALTAISGADNFNDDNTTIRDVFDIIVNNTREVTPTCKSSVIRLSVHFTYPFGIKSEPSGVLGTCKANNFLMMYLIIASLAILCTDGQSVPLSGFLHSTGPSGSRTRFSSWETLCVHFTPELEPGHAIT